MKKLRHGLVALVIVTLAILTSTTGTAMAAAPTAPFPAVVTDTVNLRSGPSTASAIVGRLQPGEQIDVMAQVGGEEVISGNMTWFRLPSGRYVYSAFTAPGNGSGASSSSAASRSGMSGRWIEVDRGAQVAKAIQNGQVVYTALITVGTQAFPTPVGNFSVYKRVLNETMDSSTIGIPRNAPGGYYLTGVLYTQYITDGVALHYNYWSPAAAFGHYPGSHGCVGMTLADSKFFWDFATIGTPVIILP